MGRQPQPNNRANWKELKYPFAGVNCFWCLHVCCILPLNIFLSCMNGRKFHEWQEFSYVVSFYSSHHRVSPLIAPIIDKTATLYCILLVTICHLWMVGIPYPWMERTLVDPTIHTSRRWGFTNIWRRYAQTATLSIHRQRTPFTDRQQALFITVYHPPTTYLTASTSLPVPPCQYLPHCQQ